MDIRASSPAFKRSNPKSTELEELSTDRKWGAQYKELHETLMKEIAIEPISRNKEIEADPEQHYLRLHVQQKAKLRTKLSESGIPAEPGVIMEISRFWTLVPLVIFFGGVSAAFWSSAYFVYLALY
jgi:hypothetical protein